MAMFKITGKVFEVGDVETYGSFSKRKVVLDVTQEGMKFQKYASFEFGGKNLSKSDDVNVGDSVEVTFDVSARKSQKNGQWYSSIDGIGIKTLSSAKSVPAPAEPDDDQSSGIDEMPF